MTTFAYKGRDIRGSIVRGKLEAASEAGVADQLIKRRIVPLEIRESSVESNAGEQSFFSLSFSKPKIKDDDVTFFARQLYTLLKAGVPIAQALKGLQDSTVNERLKAVLADLSLGLEKGEDLTTAMRRHPKVFSKLFVSMVGVGESMGKLPEVLLEISRYLQQEKDMRDRVKSAMRYPIMVTVSIAVAIAVLNVFVIPRFKDMFAAFGADLPLPTKIILGFSDFMINYWYILIFGGYGIYHLAKKYVATPSGQLAWDRIKLRVPVFGNIVFGAASARFARGFAITTNAGLPVVQGLPLVASVVDNVYLEKKFDQIRQGVERGETITQNLKKAEIFPTIIVQMISVGEETGQMESLLVEVADYFEREVDYKLKGLSSSIEPILIGFIGVIVLVVMLGVFLPLWSTIDIVKPG